MKNERNRESEREHKQVCSNSNRGACDVTIWMVYFNWNIRIMSNLYGYEIYFACPNIRFRFDLIWNSTLVKTTQIGCIICLKYKKYIGFMQSMWYFKRCKPFDGKQLFAYPKINQHEMCNNSRSHHLFAIKSQDFKILLCFALGERHVR